jgi:hypothetical protein
MTKHNYLLRKSSVGVFIAVTAAASASTVAWAGRGERAPEPFDRAEIRIELNATAEDAGVQMLLDGEGWDTVKVFSPDNKKVLRVKADGSVGDIGVTELFFESAEPSLEELPLEDLLVMFPEGEYRVEGRTVDAERLVGAATLTHAIPAAPRVVSPAEGQTTNLDDTVISWEPVADPPGSQITGYQVIVEREDPLRVFSVDLPPSATSVTVPAEFLEPGTDYKLEVLAIEEGGNQTITEIEFQTA